VPTGRAARGAAAPRGEHPDADQAERADGDELDVEQRAGGARLGDDLEQVVGAVAAERHPDELQSERRRVAGDDERTLKGVLQPTSREREEDVKEHGCGHQVERLAEGVERRGVRPSQARHEHREARGDHQRAEAAVGPPRPREHAGEDVRQRDPVHERGLQAGLAT
jgi:hypothetical protein